MNKLKLLLLIPTLFLSGCKETVKTVEPVKYNDVTWNIDYDTCNVDVISYDKEWHFGIDKLDMYVTISDGSGRQNYFYDYTNHYRLIVFLHYD